MEEVKVMTAHQALLLAGTTYPISSSPERRWAPSVTTASSRGTTMWM